MPMELSKYACDDCRFRKIRCSREAAGCVQCARDHRSCVYSRTGVIRRRTRQSKLASSMPSRDRESGGTQDIVDSTTSYLRTQMDNDISETHSTLERLGESRADASSTLDTLGAEYSSFWMGPNLRDLAKDLNMKERKFLALDEQQAADLIDTFVSIQWKGRPLFTPTPPEILQNSLLCPDKVSEKAHLVIVYGILLTEACLNDSYDRTLVMILRWNLRLALDDANLLLEPNDLNIQALTLLAVHVQEVTTPSLCWMLICTACRMLQVVGFNSKTLSRETSERHLLLFWILNAIDKHLALIFGKSPTFHGAMSASVPQVSLQTLLAWQPHDTSDRGEKSQGFQSTFGAHFMRRMHLSSVVISEIWTCLFEDGSKVDTAKSNLETWYNESISVLQACLVAEQPFLEPSTLESMKLGMKSVAFQYYHLKVLLIRTRTALKEECISSAQEALFLLKDMVSDSGDVYNGVIWVLLFCPFTPFFILFGEILSTGDCSSTQRSLDAMEALSAFLAQMKSRHPQAAKLHKIAATIVRYASEALDRSKRKLVGQHENPSGDQNSGLSGTENGIVASDSVALEAIPSEGSHPLSQDSQNAKPLLDVFNDPSIQSLSMDMDFWLPSLSSQDVYRMQTDDFGETSNTKSANDDVYGFFADSTFDWFSWDP